MWRDPIVDQVRKARDDFARRFNYDIEAIVRDVQSRQKENGAALVDRSARKLRKPAKVRARSKVRARRRSSTRSPK